MPAALELKHCRFGSLTVLDRQGKDDHGAWMWLCRCDCGASSIVRGSTLSAGRTKTCSSCASRQTSTTHGMSGTALYSRWRAMIERTSNPRHAHFANYGGRGIVVCDRWAAFEGFATDMGPSFDPNLELDRVDVNSSYSPDNCRWASRVVQQRNRRNNHVVRLGSVCLTVQEWGELLGIKPNTIITRLRRGWPTERALSTGAAAEALLEIANGGSHA